MRKFIVISAVAMAAASIAGVANAGVVNCSADGNRQRNGAIIGAIVGGVVGNNVSNKNGAPVVGAVAGAAAGSAIGCEQQKMMARDKANIAYTGNSYATTTVKVRSGPSTSAQQVGTLRKGERTEILRYEGNWAVVGYKGNYGSRQSGYVSANYLRPVQ